jgi:hypothetical protein
MTDNKRNPRTLTLIKVTGAFVGTLFAISVVAYVLVHGIISDLITFLVHHFK